jgi:hypothetical protein
MSVGEALRKLGEFLGECESSEHVTGVELTGSTDSNSGDPLTAEVEVALPVGSQGPGEAGLSLGEATVNAAGETRFVLESPTPVLPATDHEVDVDVIDTTIDTDGCVSATLSAALTVDEEESTTGAGSSDEESTTEAGSSTAGASGDPVDTAHAREVPPFRDPELLEEVYASCETFAEMTDAIGMDVTAETVRRYMIDHGIHQPDSYDTADGPGTTDVDDADADASTHGTDTDASTHDTDTDASTHGTDTDASVHEESPPGGTRDGTQKTAANGDTEHVVLTDGIGLPDDVTVEMLIETVQRSNTVLEVKRDLGIERQEALNTLQRLDMVDLVIGRLDAETQRNVSRTDVIERLRAASAAA